MADENLNVVTVGLEDSGQTVKLRIGEPLLLAVASQPSTGFAWHLMTQPDPAILYLVTNYQIPYEPDLGGRVIENWLYRPLRAGKTDIELGYNRAWEENVPPVVALIVHVVVE